MRVRRAQPEAGWTPVANTAARDYAVTWRARGLLLELLSYPDGWDTNIDKLVAIARRHGDATEGRAAMRKAVAELAKVGYVRYVRERGERNQWTTVMVVSDEPQPEPSDRRTRNRTVGKPERREPETSEGRSVPKNTDTKTEIEGVKKTGPSLSSGHTATFAAAATSVPQRREREGQFSNQKYKSLPRRLLAEVGWNREVDADYLIKEMTWRNDINGDGWWITAKKNETILDRVQEVLDDFNAEHETSLTADMWLPK